MENLILMAEGCALEQLEHEAAYGHLIQCAAVSVLIHVLLEILFTKFENENQFRLSVNDVVESNDVDMTQLLHERNFADGGGRGAFFCIEVNLLQGDDFVSRP